MMTIREYFDKLYATAQTDEDFAKVVDYEWEVYEMEDGFSDWAEANDIDLTAKVMVGGREESVLQLWAWDFED
jgi:hypothetical protein